MPQEQALLPYIDKAFGTNVQAPDMSTFRDTFTEDSKMKREEYKSVSQIGSELDAQSYKQIEGKIKGMLEKARRGELKVNSGDWVQQSGDTIAAASQLKEAEKLRKEYQEQFLSKPDQMVFMEEVNGEVVDTGLQGYLRAQENLMGQEYESPYELVQKQAEMLQRAQMLPVGVQQGIQALRNDAIKTSALLVQAGRGAVKPVSVNSGNVTFEIETNADPDEVKEMVGTLRAQHGQSLAAQYRRTGGSSGNQGLTEAQYVDQNIADMMITAARQYQIRSTPSPTTRNTGATPKEMETAKDVKPNVARAQSENNPSHINEYLRGNGFEARTRGGMWEIVEYGKSKDENARVISVVNPNNANEIYDAIAANNKNISRDAIDMFTFEGESGAENPQQREVRSEADKYITALFNPDQIKDDKGRVRFTAEELLSQLKKKFSVSGVEIVDTYEKKPSKIKIGDTTYDLSDDGNPEEAFEALRALIIGQPTPQTQPTPQPTSGVGSKYNKPK